MSTSIQEQQQTPTRAVVDVAVRQVISSRCSAIGLVMLPGVDVVALVLL